MRLRLTEDLQRLMRTQIFERFDCNPDKNLTIKALLYKNKSFFINSSSSEKAYQTNLQSFGENILKSRVAAENHVGLENFSIIDTNCNV